MKNTPMKEISPKPGMANGISTHLNQVQGDHLTNIQKEQIIESAALHFGNFLTALGVDWKNDPNSDNTPRRVAKAYVNDLWKGRYDKFPDITTFPNEGYTGMVFEGNIPIVSMCSHHHQQILGKVHIAYIPDKVMLGLSKLNRIAEHFARRGQIQELLTKDIFRSLIGVLNTVNVAVMVEATHSCVSCRGVKHHGASMITSELGGRYRSIPEVREEFYHFVNRMK